MNLLIEKHRDIIKNNNSAQEEFENIISRISKETAEIEISKDLHGNLDLSVLKKQGFKRVKIIKLAPGEITNIVNLPEGLEVFICKKNMLFQLDAISNSIVELDLEMNYLRELDIHKLSKLKKLNLADNKLSEISGFSSNIEELYLQNNNIVKLNLKEATQLRILNVSNNRTIIIENIPPSIVDFKSENNPYIEYSYTNTKQKDMHIENKNADKIHDFNQALNQYFQLKSSYEEKIHKEKSKMKKANMPKSKIRQYIPKCINCKRVGGTIFEKKNNTYIALCGIATQPCNLKIELHAGVYYSINQFIDIESSEINRNKTQILKEKMNSIYGYSSKEEIAKNFKKALSEYQFDNEEYMHINEKHNLLYYDSSREEQMIRKNKQILDLKQAIKRLIVEYKKTGNIDLLQSAIHIQIKELIPEIKNLSNLKYEIMEMKTPIELDQRYSGLKKMEHLVGGQDPFVKTFTK